MSYKSYSEVENRIQQAIVELNGEIKPNITAVAREFEVPMHRLRARFQGRQSRQDRPPTNRKLSEDQEEGLCQYLTGLDEIGIAPRYSHLNKYANSILARSDDDPTSSPPTVSAAWTQRFLKRHSEFHPRKQKTLDINRKCAHHFDDIKEWFQRYQDIREKYGILDTDSYNVDETGFQIGIGRDQWIITREPTRPMYLASSSNRELVTVMETVGGDGSVLPPLVIIPGALHMEDWYTKTNLPDDFLLGVSETGYTNDMLAMDWLVHFEHFSDRRRVGAWRLLLLDGHESHSTREFIEFCDEHKILPFCFPPHCTHLLQPLDVVVFQPYKHYHAEAIDSATRTGCSEFDKIEFLNAINSIRSATFKPSTIISGFQKTGLIPLNPEMVLAKLSPAEQEATEGPHTPPPQTTNLTSTPQTIRSLRYHANFLRSEINSNFNSEIGLALSSTGTKALETFIKGSLVQAQSGAQAFAELTNTKAAEVARAARRARSRRSIQKGGVMYAHEARKMVRQKEQESLEKQVAQAQRSLEAVSRIAENKVKKQWKDIAKDMRKAVKDQKQKIKLQKLFLRQIGHSISKFSFSCNTISSDSIY